MHCLSGIRSAHAPHANVGCYGDSYILRSIPARRCKTAPLFLPARCFPPRTLIAATISDCRQKYKVFAIKFKSTAQQQLFNVPCKTGSKTGILNYTSLWMYSGIRRLPAIRQRISGCRLPCRFRRRGRDRRCRSRQQQRPASLPGHPPPPGTSPAASPTFPPPW